LSTPASAPDCSSIRWRKQGGSCSVLFLLPCFCVKGKQRWPLDGHRRKYSEWAKQLADRLQVHSSRRQLHLLAAGAGPDRMMKLSPLFRPKVRLAEQHQFGRNAGSGKLGWNKMADSGSCLQLVVQTGGMRFSKFCTYIYVPCPVCSLPFL
jgi:hypothetical protein